MATPFDDGRVCIIVSDWSLTIPYRDIPTWATDVAIPAHDPMTTSAKYNEVRDNAAQRGTKTQLWYDGTHGQTGADLAVAIDVALRAIPQHGGGVEVDIENASDGVLLTVVQDWYTRQRQLRPTRALGLNLAPLKGFVLTPAMAADPFFHVRVQPYYGAEMRPAAPDECKRDICGPNGSRFPEDRFSFCYSAKARKLSDGTVFCDLPVFADHAQYVRRLRKGSVFSLNLMREAGLL